MRFWKAIGLICILLSILVMNGCRSSVSISRKTGTSSVPPTQLTISGSATTTAGTCTPFTVTAQDSTEAAASASADITVNLGGVGFGGFYSDSACSSAITSLRIASGSSSTGYYYKNIYGETGLNFTAQDATSTLTAGQFSASSNATVAKLFQKYSSGSICAILNSGAHWCWNQLAYNLGGRAQLGAPTTLPSFSQSTLSGIGLGDTALCGVLSSGVIQCLGDNISGMLGNNSTTPIYTPTTVSGGSIFSSVSVGLGHACGLLTSGGVQCWGWNNYGQLGNNSTTDSSVPVNVQGISTATALSAGYASSCALLSGGSVKCWGYNGWGDLGDTTTISRSVPVSVNGVTTATAIASSSDHSCALLNNNTIKCWGYNGFGQLGDNTTTASSTPIAVTLAGSAIAIGAGSSHTCALLSSGSVQCWGYNFSGGVGDGTTTDRHTPVTVSGLSNAVMLSVGQYNSCALLNDYKTLKCWGYALNSDGTDAKTPLTMPSFTISGAATQLAISPFTPIYQSQCVPMAVITLAADGTPSRALTSSATVNLGVSGGGSGVFYSDSDCTHATTTVNLNSGSNFGLFYFKDTWGNDDLNIITPSAAGFTSVPTTVVSGCNC